jgi:hypothetical protein
MPTELSTAKSMAISLAAAVATRLRRLHRACIDFLDNRDGRLTAMQRFRLMDVFRGERDALVEDAEERGISDEGAARLSLVRSVIRWLDREVPPGPDAVPFLERLLADIYPDPQDDELSDREELLAAIQDLGGDHEAAARIWRAPPDPEPLADYGLAVHREMRRAGLTVAELSALAELEPSLVVALIYGTEEARASETLRLAGALGVEPGEFVNAMEVKPRGRLSSDIGLNRDHPSDCAGLDRDRPSGDDKEAQP